MAITSTRCRVHLNQEDTTDGFEVAVVAILGACFTDDNLPWGRCLAGRCSGRATESCSSVLLGKIRRRGGSVAALGNGRGRRHR